MNQNGMSEKEVMSDALYAQKHITSTYNTFANECVTPLLRDEFLNLLNEEHQIQAELFNEMQKRGWYQAENAEQQKIEQAKQKYQSFGNAAKQSGK